MCHMNLRGLPMKKDSYTAPPAHAILRALEERNGLTIVLKKSVDDDVWCTVAIGIPDDITRMRIFARGTIDGSAIEDIDAVIASMLQPRWD